MNIGNPIQVINIPTVSPTVRSMVPLSPFFKVKTSIIIATIDKIILSIIEFL